MATPARPGRTGSTPGSLGVSDHGTPLPRRSALLLSERRQDIEAHIDRIIGGTDFAALSRTEQKLQACLDAANNRDSVDHSQDEVGRCAEAYFYARLHALKGKSAVTDGSHEEAPWRDALQIGGVEYRAAGAFFQPVGRPPIVGRGARLELRGGSGRPYRDATPGWRLGTAPRIGSRRA